MKKKNIIKLLVFSVIFISIIVISIIYFIEKSKYNYEIMKIEQVDYNIINREDRYGVINRKGEIIIEPIYDIVQIPNPSKPVFICMNEYNVEKKEYKIKVFNEKSEEIYTQYDSVQAIPTETTYDGIPFEKTVLKYKKGEKYGLLSIDGKELTKAVYSQISGISYKEGMLLVNKDEKYGVININGKTIIKPEYQNIKADNYYSDTTYNKMAGFIVSKKTDEGYRYGYINYKGKLLVDTEYTEIERVTEIQDDNNVYLVALKNGQAGLLKNKKLILNYEYETIKYNLYNDIFIIQRNGKQGICNKDGIVQIQPEYERILFGGIYINTKKDGEQLILDLNGIKVENTDFVSKLPTKDKNYYIVEDKNGIYKIIDKNGKIVIDSNYTYIEELNNNYFIVANGTNNGIIDLSGKFLIDLKYNSIFQIEGTELIQANIAKTNTVSIIDKNMKILATMDEAKVEKKNEYISVYSETQSKYFNYAGKELSNQEIFKNNKLYAKKINNKWGFVDRNGELKVKNEYDMVTEFNEYGFAGIKKNGKWGSINEDGKIVQEPIYTIEWQNPVFIGEFYQSFDWLGDIYYTDKIVK